MATTTFQPYTGNGSNKDFNYSFPTFTASEVVVEVDGVIVDNFHIVSYSTTGTNTVRFDNGDGQGSNSSGTVNTNVCANDGSPLNNLEVIVRRDTNVDVAKATYTAGASLKAESLTNNNTQILRALQEEQNTPITTPRLRDGQVTSAKIKDGTIQTADIAGDQITNALIADDQIDSEHYVDLSIDTQHIANLNVTTAKLDNDAVTASKLADDAVVTDNIVNLNVTRGKIANDAIDGTKIDDDAVDSEHIAADSLDTEHYAPNSVDATAIGPNAVTTVKILNDAVTIDKINDDVIVTAAEQANAASNDTSFLTVAAADARFFNISTGDTIKDGQAFPDNDTTIATTAAINDRIIDLVDDVGGFVPIANETSFPNANPDVNNGAGTIVSVAAASTSLNPSGTTLTIANGTVGNSTVTITGNAAVIPAGFGFLVETTSTLNTYTFHRLVPKATEVTTVAGISGNVTTVANNNANVTTVATNIASVNTTAGDIANVNTTAGSIANVNTVATNIANVNTTAGSIANVNTTAGSIANVNTTATNIASVNNASANINSINNFGDTYQVHSNNPTTDGGGNPLAAGDLYFDTSANELKVYNGSAWQGGVTATGNFAVVTGNTFTGDNRYNDGVKLKLGTGSDLQIYHSGTGSYIDHSGSGNGHLFIRGNGTDAIILRAKQGENSIACHSDGDVSLYYDGSEKLQTLNSGVEVIGNITVSGNVDGRDLAADGAKLDTYEANGSSYLRSDAADIKTSGDLTFNDNVKATFGTGNDLEIYHDGSGSAILNGASSGQLTIASDNALNLTSRTGTEYFFRGYTNGAAELYHDNSKKLETAGFGAKITGDLEVEDADPKIHLTATSARDYYFHNDAGTFKLRDETASNAVRYQLGGDGKHYIYGDANVMGTSDLTVVGGDLKLTADNAKLQLGAGQDLDLYHNGNHSFIDNSTGQLYIRSPEDIILAVNNTENGVNIIDNGAVELFYNNVKKFETTSSGVSVTGQLSTTDTISTVGNLDMSDSTSTGNNRIRLGTGDDLEIYHDGSHSRIVDNGANATSIQTNLLRIHDNSGNFEYMAEFNANGAVELYHDNSKKFETTSGGIGVVGSISQTSAGAQNSHKFGSANSFLYGQYNSSGDASINNQASANLLFATANSERMRIDSSGNVNIANDSGKLRLGASADLQLYHNGTNSFVSNSTGKLMVQNTNGNIQFEAKNGEDSCKMIPDGAVELYYDNSLKLATNASGVNVTGTVTATSFVGSGAGLTGISAIPTGMVAPFAQGSVPSGWLECNGNSVSRSTYADLFSAIGTTYGAGNGSTTFQVPELRGEFIRGLDNSRGIDSGRANGSFQDHGIPAMKGHISDAHGQSRLQTFAQSGFTNVFDGVGTSSWRTSIHAVSGNYASIMFDSTNVIPAADHVRPRNVAMMYCIKT